jgi:hypothetical protein
MKTKSYLIFLLLWFPMIGFSQKKESIFKKIFYGLSIEADYCNRQLFYGSINEKFAAIRNNEEQPGLGFTLGANVQYRLSEKITLESGILFSNFTINTKMKDLTWQSNKTDLPTKSQTVFTTQNFSVPLKVNYNVRVGRLQGYFTTGLSINYLFNSNTSITTYLPDNSSYVNSHDQNIGYETLSVSLLAGFGIVYPISNRLVLNIEPIYRQGISSIVEDKNANEYQYSLGLNAKVFYNLKKKKYKN